MSQFAASFPNIDQTSNTAVQEALARTAAVEVQQRNADLIARYQSAYADYVANMRTGQNVPAERRVPPKPPMGYRMSAPDANGYVFLEVGDQPVCPQGPAVECNADFVAPHPVANHISINWASRPKGPSVGSYVTANLDDGMPGGFRTPPLADPTDASGALHSYLRLTTAVGPGWYQQLD